MPIFQKRHYEAIAAVIAGFDSTTRAHVATCFAGMLAWDNAKFDRELFLAACGQGRTTEGTMRDAMNGANRWQNPQPMPAAPATPRPFAVGDIVAPNVDIPVPSGQPMAEWRRQHDYPVWTAATRLRVIALLRDGESLHVEGTAQGETMGLGGERWPIRHFIHAELIPMGSEQDGEE